MAKINLLPWREERRQELKKEFLTILAFVVLLAAAAVIAANMFFSGKISAQENRNQYLQTNITELDRQVKEIQNINKKREELLTRMEVIQNLQGNRPVIVRVFDELVRTLPNGVYFTDLDLKGSNLSVNGIAESNNRISSLMRRADGSDWFGEPNLTAVTGDKALGEQASKFSMTAVVTKPAIDKKEDK